MCTGAHATVLVHVEQARPKLLSACPERGGDHGNESVRDNKGKSFTNCANFNFNLNCTKRDIFSSHAFEKSGEGVGGLGRCASVGSIVQNGIIQKAGGEGSQVDFFKYCTATVGQSALKYRFWSESLTVGLHKVQTADTTGRRGRARAGRISE